MSTVIMYLLINILIGCGVCFYGKKLYFLVIMLMVFLISLLFSVQFMGLNVKGVLVGVVIGIIFAWVSVGIYRVGVFVIGAVAGLIISFSVVDLLPKGEGDTMKTVATVLTIVISLAIGILAAIFGDLFIMICTSYSGASLVATNACFLGLNATTLDKYVSVAGNTFTLLQLNTYMNKDFTKQYSMLIFIVSIILAIIGFTFQNNREKRKKQEKYGEN